MKKSRGALALLLVLMLAACVAVLSACGASQSGNQASAGDEKLSVDSEPEESEEPIILKTEPFYVLVVGDDTREGTPNKTGQYSDGLGRSDTLMLVRVDPTNYKLTFLTIARDTQASYEGEVCKINETYHKGGIKALMNAVEELTGVTPDHYLITTFVEFQKLVDDLGGLTITVPIYEEMNDIVSNETVAFDAGEQTLDGKEALIFARDRHAYDAYEGGGEAYRQTNDRRIIQRMVEQVLETPDKAVSVAEKLLKHINTDWEERELLAYIEDFAAHADDVSYIRATGPYMGELDYESELWLAYRDEEAWAAIIDLVDEGEDPAEIVAEPISWEQDFMNPAEDEGEGEEAEGEEGSEEGEEYAE